MIKTPAFSKTAASFNNMIACVSYLHVTLSYDSISCIFFLKNSCLRSPLMALNNVEYLAPHSNALKKACFLTPDYNFFLAFYYSTMINSQRNLSYPDVFFTNGNGWFCQRKTITLVKLWGSRNLISSICRINMFPLQPIWHQVKYNNCFCFTGSLILSKKKWHSFFLGNLRWLWKQETSKSSNTASLIVSTLSDLFKMLFTDTSFYVLQFSQVNLNFQLFHFMILQKFFWYTASQFKSNVFHSK